MTGSRAVTGAPPRPDTLLRLSGRLDLDATRQLSRRLFELARTSRTLQLDLSAIDRVERSGLALLIGCPRIAHAHGGRVQLVAASPEAARALRAAGLHRVLPLVPAESPAALTLRSP
jgi:anti-anti-sigma factor